MHNGNMKDKDTDKYLSEHLTFKQPREAFKQRVLGDSMVALARVQRRRSARRRAGLATAAVLIAGIAFLGGRLSKPRTLPRNVDVALQVAAEPDGVTVPSDVVAWMDAARLFKRLGMEERMVRAFEHAGKLLPYDATAAKNITEQDLTAYGYNEVFENKNKHSILAEILGPHQSVESMSGIIAHSFGGYYNESKMD